ncbi:hypothetical protein HYW19_00075 [Candidatus Woesearchaeota archaeon]|nr:hypothetical protein [Candidatus Woesearchaeota archaeon]
MKKIAAILALAIFLISLIPLSIAKEGSDGQKRLEEQKKDVLDAQKERLRVSNASKDDLLKERNFAELKKERLDRIKELKDKEIEKLKVLDKEKLERISKLSKERLEKLSGLREEQIKRLAEVKEERLRKMAGLSEEQLKKIAELDARQLEKLSQLDKARLEEFSKLNKEKLKEKLDKIQIKKVDERLKFKARIVSEDKIKSAREKFEKAEENLHDAEEKINERRRLLLAAKESGDDEAVIEHAKQGLLRAADAIIAHLEKVKSKVQESEQLSEEEVNEIIADLDAKITEINDAKAAVEAAATKEEIRDAAKNINAAWKRIKSKTEQHTRNLVNEQVRGILKRSEHLERKLDRILAEMEEKGIEVEGIDEKVAAFSEKVADARDKLKQSQEKFREAKATGVEDERKALLEKAKSLAREAHEALKEANNILKEIVMEIKEVYKEADFEKEGKEDLVEVVEEDKEKQKAEVEIEGILTPEQQSIVDNLVNSLQGAKTSAEIEIEAEVGDGNVEVKKKVKGTLSGEQQFLVDELAASLETAEDKVNIGIEVESDDADDEEDEEDVQEDEDEENGNEEGEEE